MLLIRLKKKNNKQHLYHIVITTRMATPSRGFIEKVGTYQAIVDNWANKYLFINNERLLHWICKGAQAHTSFVMPLIAPALLNKYEK